MQKKELESEANLFAILLLIPEKFIREDLANGIDLTDDKAIKELCKKYDVSLVTMTKRISLLNLKYKQ